MLNRLVGVPVNRSMSCSERKTQYPRTASVSNIWFKSQPCQIPPNGRNCRRLKYSGFALPRTYRDIRYVRCFIALLSENRRFSSSEFMPVVRGSAFILIAFDPSYAQKRCMALSIFLGGASNNSKACSWKPALLQQGPPNRAVNHTTAKSKDPRWRDGGREIIHGGRRENEPMKVTDGGVAD